MTAVLAALKASSGNLAKARMQWEETKQSLRKSQADVNELNAKRGAASQSLKEAETQREHTAKQAELVLDECLRVTPDKRVARQLGTLGKG